MSYKRIPADGRTLFTTVTKHGVETLPSPQFRVFGDGSLGGPTATIVPNIGTPGTFSRASSLHYPDSANTVALVSTDTPANNAVPADVNAPGTARKGVLIAPGTRNNAFHSIAFDNWTPIGSPTVTANAITAPDGNMTADRLELADGEGVEIAIDSASEFSNPWVTLAAYIRAVGSDSTLKIRLKDQSGTPNYWTEESHPDGFVVSGSLFKPYTVYGHQFNGGTGNNVIEITSVGTSDVYIWGMLFHFTGESEVWDTNLLGGWIPAYDMIVGASRETTEETKLKYAGSELQTEISECTLSGFFYFPKGTSLMFSGGGADHWLMSAETATEKVIAMYVDGTTQKLFVRLGRTTEVSTNLYLPRVGGSSWLHIVMAIKSGDSAIYINGIKVFSDTNTFSNFTLDTLTPGQIDNEITGEEGNQNFLYPISTVELWTNKRFTDDEVSTLHTLRAGDDKEKDSTAYEPSTSGATEIWDLSLSPGNNLTSDLLADLYTAAGTPLYFCHGPQGLRGVNFHISGSHFTHTTLGNELNIGASDDFVLIAQFEHDRDAPDVNHILLDLGYDNAAHAGIWLQLNSARFDLIMEDDASLAHQSRYTHNGLFWRENLFYTVRIVMDRANSTGRLYYKVEGEDEVGPITMDLFGTGFDSYGAISPEGAAARIGGPSHQNGSHFDGIIYRVALAVGSNTYDFTNKP